MKLKIQNFIDGLIPYDYILFGSVLALFVLFIVLAILLRKKITLAIFLVLLAFATFLLGPTLGYVAMHKFLFKNHLLSAIKSVSLKPKKFNKIKKNLSEVLNG